MEYFETSLLHDANGDPVGYVHDVKIRYSHSDSPTGQVTTSWDNSLVELLDLEVKEPSTTAQPRWEMVTVGGDRYSYERR